jgi:uncharacterized phiE125 gp8 family phage protein
MKTALVTAPAYEPVTLSDMRDHLRVTTHDDDAYLTALIVAAREWSETFTRRCFVQQTWDQWFDGFPSGDRIELSKAPLVSVTGVYYTDYAESTTTMTVSTEYVVDSDSVPGAVCLAYGTTWPSFTPSVKNPVKVRYVAGYSAAASDDSPPVYDYRANVPKSIKHAIKLIVGHYYNNRENTIAGVGLTDIPFGAEYLLWPYRILSL